ncbi:glycosyltransferase family 39 protein [Ruminococcus sp.]|uniref:ArnT family glycosyltransferase n=1 Tax=Ruminococcus sp. TaxID=41978 RepID=UPI0025D3AC53|nr:glycosyltransferase family 39 protein [Ruminococcus sp.]
MVNKSSINKGTARVFDILSSHPYVCAFIVCLFVHFFTFAQEELIPANTMLIGSAVLAFAGIGTVWAKYKKGQFPFITAIFFSIAVIGVIFAFNVSFISGGRGVWIIFVCLAAMIPGSIYFRKHILTKEKNERFISLILLGTGFLTKLMYIFYTDMYARQNDVGAFTGTPDDAGHFGYIEYLLYNHHLADFDVRTRWQFYHPPLHHTISAVWIYINQNIFGLDFNSSRESLQILSLFYTMVIIITAYKILRYFKLSGVSLYAPLAVISFHPAFTFFSGALNNDPLATALTALACLASIKWYESQKMKDIIILALCIGLGMMTKLSAALVAFPVAFLFLIVFITNIKKKWKKFSIQYICFGAICFPLALWYQIRSHFRFGVPITYVQELGKDIDQYVGNTSFWDRVTNFSAYQFKGIFQHWAYRDENGMLTGHNEMNPLICILKNSIFGEENNESRFRISEHISSIMTVFFIVNLIIAAAAIVFMIAICFRKTTANTGMKAFFIVFHIIMIANFYKMAADYPFVCTMNFRYITLTVMTGALFCGLFLQSLQKSSKRVKNAANKISITLSVLFSVCAIWEITAMCYPR